LGLQVCPTVPFLSFFFLPFFSFFLCVCWALNPGPPALQYF
jgi:hypothetical protein